VQAQGRDVARRESAPPNEGWRQTPPYFSRPELEQTRAVSLGESSRKTGGDGCIDLSRVIRSFAEEMPTRRQTESQATRRCTSVFWPQPRKQHAIVHRPS
jgi:hypothetical protein